MVKPVPPRPKEHSFIFATSFVGQTISIFFGEISLILRLSDVMTLRGSSVFTGSQLSIPSTQEDVDGF